MKKIVGYFIVVILLSAFAPSIMAGATSTDVRTPALPSTSTKPDIVITAFGGSGLLDFAELYNQTSRPIELAGTQLQFTIHDVADDGCADQAYSITAPDGWLLPKSYFTFERGEVSDDTEAHYTPPLSLLDGCQDPELIGVDLINRDGLVDQEINFAPSTLTATNWAQHKQRSKSSLSVTGVFANDYNLSSSDVAELYSMPLYQPPADAGGLRITEILPNPSNCSPADTSPLCTNYVKLFNASDTPMDLSVYRLRTSYGGSNSSSSNTVSLSGTLQPGQYKVINSKGDGSSLSLTQTGGYVWLEDARGAKVYEPAVSYPDASSDSKIGYSWAFDGKMWRWTNSPEPTSSNVFTMELLTKPIEKVSTRKPCAPGQVRNPTTNRCRKNSSTAKALEACKPGQERNSATGRCRSVLGAIKTKKPCKPGQERNPDTGRCRKSQPKISNVKDIKTTAETHNNHWYIVAAVAAGAAAYVIYEWQQEFVGSIKKIKFKFRQIFRIRGRQKIQNLLK